MKFGICGDYTLGPAMAALGFDFLEPTVPGSLKPLESHEAFMATRTAVRACPIPYNGANMFVPPTLKIVGPDIIPGRLRRYVAATFRRASHLGMKIIVFGSGSARQIPDGFSRNTAWQQMVDFGRMAAKAAKTHGLTVIVEPLNRIECNMLRDTTEAAQYVREINHPSIRMLVDSYHWGMNGESVDDIVAAGPLIQHIHVSTFPGRQAPGADDCDLKPFFGALKKIGYDGTVCIECKWKDVATEAGQALRALKQLAQGG